MINSRKEKVAKNQELYDKIKKILIKKAEGYYFSEESLEYAQKPQKIEEQISFDDILENGKKKSTEENLVLVKKKITSHYIPPDMIAIKILLENFGENLNIDSFENMTEEELIIYKNKLITNLEKLLKENKNDN